MVCGTVCAFRVLVGVVSLYFEYVYVISIGLCGAVYAFCVFVGVMRLHVSMDGGV